MFQMIHVIEFRLLKDDDTGMFAIGMTCAGAVKRIGTRTFASDSEALEGMRQAIAYGLERDYDSEAAS